MGTMEDTMEDTDMFFRSIMDPTSSSLPNRTSHTRVLDRLLICSLMDITDTLTLTLTLTLRTAHTDSEDTDTDKVTVTHIHPVGDLICSTVPDLVLEEELVLEEGKEWNSNPRTIGLRLLLLDLLDRTLLIRV